MNVIRRPARVRDVQPAAACVETPKGATLTPEQVRRDRARQIHNEVVGLFKNLGALT